jgi:hypothetical protein
MSLQTVIQIFEDADIFNYIKSGALPTTYDKIAQTLFNRLSKDLTIHQIQNIIWEEFYKFICIGTVDDKEVVIIDRRSAFGTIGEPNKFKGIALNIRNILYGI